MRVEGEGRLHLTHCCKRVRSRLSSHPYLVRGGVVCLSVCTPTSGCVCVCADMSETGSSSTTHVETGSSSTGPAAVVETGCSSTSTTHVALDLGTGETKVLRFRRTKGGSVEVTELAKLASLKGLFDGASASSSSFSAAADGGNKQAQELTDCVRAIVRQESPAHCFAGVTSWFRTASTDEQRAVESFFQRHLPEFHLLKLSGRDEALKESIAVTFAAVHAGIGQPDTQVAAGGGSMQLVQGPHLYSIEQGFRAGQAELMGDTKPRRVVCEALEARADETFASFREGHPGFSVARGKIVGYKYFCFDMLYITP